MLEEEPDDSEVLPTNLVGKQAIKYFREFKAELEETYKLTASDTALLVNYCNMQAKLDSVHKTLSDNPIALDQLRIKTSDFMKTVLDLTRQQANIAAVIGLGVINRNRIKRSAGSGKSKATPETPKLLQFAKKG